MMRRTSPLLTRRENVYSNEGVKNPRVTGHGVVYSKEGLKIPYDYSIFEKEEGYKGFAFTDEDSPLGPVTKSAHVKVRAPGTLKKLRFGLKKSIQTEVDQKLNSDDTGASFNNPINLDDENGEDKAGPRLKVTYRPPGSLTPKEVQERLMQLGEKPKLVEPKALATPSNGQEKKERGDQESSGQPLSAESVLQLLAGILKSASGGAAAEEHMETKETNALAEVVGTAGSRCKALDDASKTVLALSNDSMILVRAVAMTSCFTQNNVSQLINLLHGNIGGMSIFVEHPLGFAQIGPYLAAVLATVLQRYKAAPNAAGLYLTPRLIDRWLKNRTSSQATHDLFNEHPPLHELIVSCCAVVPALRLAVDGVYDSETIREHFLPNFEDEYTSGYSMVLSHLKGDTTTLKNALARQMKTRMRRGLGKGDFTAKTESSSDGKVRALPGDAVAKAIIKNTETMYREWCSDQNLSTVHVTFVGKAGVSTSGGGSKSETSGGGVANKTNNTNKQVVVAKDEERQEKSFGTKIKELRETYGLTNAEARRFLGAVGKGGKTKSGTPSSQTRPQRRRSRSGGSQGGRNNGGAVPENSANRGDSTSTVMHSMNRQGQSPSVQRGLLETPRS